MKVKIINMFKKNMSFAHEKSILESNDLNQLKEAIKILQRKNEQLQDKNTRLISDNEKFKYNNV